MSSHKRPLRFLVTGALLAGSASGCGPQVESNEPMPVNEEPPVDEVTNNEPAEEPEPEPETVNEVEPEPEPVVRPNLPAEERMPTVNPAPPVEK